MSTVEERIDVETRPLAHRDRADAEARPWNGPLRHYDIVKEATIAVVVVAIITVVLAVLFSSPDERPVTIKQWSSSQPAGFTQIALSELQGTSDSATYGQPYNSGNADVQSLGPVPIQKFFGVAWPLHPARSFVVDPLSTLPADPTLTGALHQWETATPAQHQTWTDAYNKAVAKLGPSARVPTRVPGAGPVPEMLTTLLGMARTGALDAALVTHGSFYSSDYTNPIMFIGDSWKAQKADSYWGHIVAAEHLKGSQWGVMNETGSWPGQPWLWLYTMWYQVPPMSTSGNGDVLVVAIMAVLSIGLLLLPFIPGLRSIPRWIPVHRIIWRDYYRQNGVGT